MIELKKRGRTAPDLPASKFVSAISVIPARFIILLKSRRIFYSIYSQAKQEVVNSKSFIYF